MLAPFGNLSYFLQNLEYYLNIQISLISDQCLSFSLRNIEESYDSDVFCLLVDLSTRWCRKGFCSYTLELDKIPLLSSSSMRAIGVHLKDGQPPFLRTVPSPRECQRAAWMLVSKAQGRDPGPDQMDQTETRTWMTSID